MSAISVRLPESLHKKLRDLTVQDDISMNQFIVSAIAEKVAVYYADELYAERATRGKEKRLQDVLKQVRKRPADEYDKL